jgi:hypothetical protein
MTKKRLIKKFLKDPMPVIRAVGYIESKLPHEHKDACDALWEVYLYEKYRPRPSSFREFLARTASL